MKIGATKTGQTVQERTAYFEIGKDQEGWHWVLWSGNGRVLARNPQPYERRKDVLQAVKNLAKLVPSVKYIAAGEGSQGQEEPGQEQAEE